MQVFFEISFVFSLFDKANDISSGFEHAMKKSHDFFKKTPILFSFFLTKFPKNGKLCFEIYVFEQTIYFL